jgi:sulfur carrier protein
MRLNVNGEARVSACRDLAELWRAETAELELANPKGFAIALNGAVVRRDAWASTPLAEGDRVEIIRAMQGG